MVIKDLINLEKIQNNIDKIQKEFNNVLEKFNESLFGNYKRPAINISQNSNFVLINIEMNGLDKNDISIKVHNNSLEIVGERKRKIIKKKGEESTYRGYRANVGLPMHLHLDNIKAVYKDNNLKIAIPKMKTKIGSKIDIK